MGYIEQARQNNINAQKAAKLDAIENYELNRQEAMGMVAAEIDKFMQEQRMNAPRSLAEAYLMDMDARSTQSPVMEAEYTTVPSRDAVLQPSVGREEEQQALNIINSL